MYSPYETGDSAIPMRQSRLVQTGQELRESLLKLQAQIHDLKDQLGAVLLPEPSSQVATPDRESIDREPMTEANGVFRDALQLVHRLSEEVSILARRLEV